MDFEKEISLRGAVYRQARGQGRISIVAPAAHDEEHHEDVTSTSASNPVRCQFDLVQYQNGNIYAFCSVYEDDVSQALHAHWNNQPSGTIIFVGTTESGLSVQLEKAMATTTNVHSSTGQPVTVQTIFNITHAHFTDDAQATSAQTSSPWQARFWLVNLTMPPVPDHPYNDALAGQLQGAPVSIACAGSVFHLEATPDANDVLKELERTKGVAVTATATTFMASREELEAREKLLSDLHAVLTLMEGTRINDLGCDLINSQGEMVESWWHNAVTRPYRGTSLLNQTLPGDYEMSFGADLFRQSAETMMARFREREESLGIRSLIHSFVDATIMGNYLELRGLMLGGCVEMLRAHHLATKGEVHMVAPDEFAGVLPALQSRMRKVLEELLPGADDSTLSSMTGHLQNINYTSFRRALRSLFKTFGLQSVGATPREKKQATEAAISAFITTRDALVHYGRFAVPPEPIEGWDHARISRVRWRQYQFMEKVAALLLAAALDWKVVRPDVSLPSVPEIWEG